MSSAPDALTEADREIVKGGLYRHYKGMMYRAIDIVRHSESLEELVLYETLYENKLGKLWVRPKAMFLSDIEINGQILRRFQPVQS
jgi:hypothetical protein